MQFEAFLKAATELEAQERAAFVTDMSVVVGSLFSKDNPAGDHLTLLAETAAGIVHGEAKQRA